MSNAKWKIVPVEPVAWVIEGTLPGGERLTHYDDSKVGAECGFDDLCMETIGEPVPLYAAAPEPDWEELAEQIYAYYWNDYDANGSASLVRALKITFGSKP